MAITGLYMFIYSLRCHYQYIHLSYVYIKKFLVGFTTTQESLIMLTIRVCIITKVFCMYTSNLVNVKQLFHPPTLWLSETSQNISNLSLLNQVYRMLYVYTRHTAVRFGMNQNKN